MCFFFFIFSLSLFHLYPLSILSSTLLPLSLPLFLSPIFSHLCALLLLSSLLTISYSHSISSSSPSSLSLLSPSHPLLPILHALLLSPHLLSLPLILISSPNPPCPSPSLLSPSPSSSSPPHPLLLLSPLLLLPSYAFISHSHISALTPAAHTCNKRGAA